VAALVAAEGVGAFLDLVDEFCCVLHDGGPRTFFCKIFETEEMVGYFPASRFAN
jgi:hypothetical protein